MNIQTLENRKLELEQELAAKRQWQAVEDDLAAVEAKLASEQKRRYSLRQDWLNRMKQQQQARLKAEAEEKQLLAEINAFLLPMLERLNDARTRKDDAIHHIIGIFESEHTRHNINRVGTSQHFHDSMREIGIDVGRFPPWSAKRRLHGEFFRSEYQNPNTGLLAMGIDQAAASVKK